MSLITHGFTICLWFDNQAEEAAKFYTSIFKDGKIGKTQRYGKEGFEFHQRPEGSVMTVDFDANGLKFTALNGGPIFQFNESISLIITCDTQKEIDYYWEKLTAQGGTEVQCGWRQSRDERHVRNEKIRHSGTSTSLPRLIANSLKARKIFAGFYKQNLLSTLQEFSYNC